MTRFLLLLLLPVFAMAQQPNWQLSQRYWQSQDFIDRFMGNYGFRGEIEPTINSEEQEVLQQAIPMIQMGNTQLAIQTLRVGITPQSSAALDFTLGNLYFQQGNFGPARQAYQQALTKFPNFLNAHKNLAFIEVQDGNYRTAIPSLIKVIELGAGNSDTYGLLAYSYLNLEQPASAESAYRQALLLDPESVDWRNGLIQTLLTNRRFDEAISRLEEVIEQDPSRSEYWMIQANAFLQTDQVDRATANLEMLRRMGMASGRALMLLGDLYMQQRMPLLALTAYEGALEQREQMKPEQFTRVAQILIGQGEYAGAESYLKRVEEIYGDDLTPAQQVGMLNMRSEIFLATKRPEEAAEILREVVRMDPLDGKANMLLANYEWDKGNIERAATYYEDASKDDDFRVRALVEHARMRAQERQYEQAVELMREASNLDPGNTQYGNWLDQLIQAREVQRRRAS